MNEILAALVGAIAGAIAGTITAVFLAPLEWLAWALQRRLGPAPSVHQLFGIEFVNEQGQNIYVKNDDPCLKAGDGSWFKVQVRFRLRAKEQVVLTNIDLDYPDISGTPSEQYIHFDGVEVKTDNRYGLQQPRGVSVEDVLDVRINRTFLAKAQNTWDGDYKHVSVLLEFTTRRGSGFQKAYIVGLLGAGGKVSNVEAKMLSSDIQRKALADD